ncbi:hypothetical protein CWI38_1640p0010 [Hamiltosporidium tvaerminnensis]|uniref:Uncharacterized protein n=1 Tax=Hamiltosporidium tvaerminnensis TaxID=1176355 RepID=A0A4Q9LQW6_9MICR|nr:hypothetical protein CWI38_1640p0010 [Hamiltosporidium tvaerminnensis]
MEFESSDNFSAEEVNAQKEPNLNINTEAFDVYKLYLDRVVSLPFIKTNQDTLKSDQKQPNIFFKNCKYINYEVLQNDYFENARRCYSTFDKEFYPKYFGKNMFEKYHFYKICVTYMENRIKKLVSYVKSEPFLQFENFNAFLKKFSPHFNAENVTSCGPSFIPISVNYVGGRSQSDEKIFLFDIDDVFEKIVERILDGNHTKLSTVSSHIKFKQELKEVLKKICFANFIDRSAQYIYKEINLLDFFNSVIHIKSINRYTAILKPEESAYKSVEEFLGTSPSNNYFFDNKSKNIDMARERCWNVFEVEIHW